MKETELLIERFRPVSLSDIDKVKLMDRIDRKYWFHFSQLNELLETVIPFYDILEINNNRLMEYQSVYFDTPDNYMYLKHHNRKLHRYKVRRRTYVSTNDDFFEIKLKTNKKRTIKKRIESHFSSENLLDKESDFLEESTPFRPSELRKTLNNRFRRITLIHKEKLDRCTIDIHPEFWNNNGSIELKNLVVFELKHGKNFKTSPMISVLRKLKIRQRGLSKYCTGRALLDPELKQNAFKPRLQFIRKYILN